MLKIENATKIFNLTGNAEDARIAMDNMNLDIADGEFVTIIGSNGSGKSTLMNVVSGVHQLDEGKITINNKDVTKMKEYKRAAMLGRVFQDPKRGTASNMSIIENLMVASRRARSKNLHWGFDKNLRSELVKRIMTLNLGLENRLDQKVGLLSGGQRQAITLIMATLVRPDILLLDEHTAALDPKTAKIVLEITNQIVTESKITTLMITHNMRDAIKYGDRLIMLDAGKVIFDIKGDAKRQLTIEQLLTMFESHSEVVLSDQMILS